MGCSLPERDSRVTVPCWSAAPRRPRRFSPRTREATMRVRSRLRNDGMVAWTFAQRRRPAWSPRWPRSPSSARSAPAARAARATPPTTRASPTTTRRRRGVARRPDGRPGGVRRLPGAAVPGRDDEPAVDVRLGCRHRVVQQPAPPAEPGRRAGGGPDRGAGQLLRLRLPDAGAGRGGPVHRHDAGRRRRSWSSARRPARPTRSATGRSRSGEGQRADDRGLAAGVDLLPVCDLAADDREADAAEARRVGDRRRRGRPPAPRR